MNIKVTQEHIDKGIRGKCRLCPIALAIKDEIGKIVMVNVFDVDIDGQVIRLPTTAFDFVQRFDADLKVSPFTFELEL